MRYLYTFLFYLLLPFIMLRLLWRSLKAPAYRRRWSERFGFFKLPPNFKNAIWIHAVSVGEVLSAVPLIQSLQKQYPHHVMLVTTMTPTGSARVQSLFKESVYHIYLPYDLPCIIKRFLNKIQPKIAIIMETEIWPNLLHECHQRHIPILIGNARLSLKSMRYYSFFKKFIKNCLKHVSIIAPQSKRDAEHFLQLGVDPHKIQLLGNIKFDVKPPEGIETKAKNLRKQLGEKRIIWVVGSTHEGEDEQILDAYQHLKAAAPNTLLILVPRHPERFENVSNLCKSRGFTIARRSLKETCNDSTDIYLGDTMGEMMTFYATSDIAYVGGSLVPTGGHNLLEPALFSLPILTGPHTFNFQEITRQLQEANGLIMIHHSKELAQKVIELINDSKLRNALGKRAHQVILNNRGSLQKHLKLISDLLTTK
ncbi:MAG: lipid IV(A) 3-deoxy-D-manno-octulosonic acid transferase [Gammaproteobacteria bacterium]|nr:lipid IV(A) 3-deoxy-D-manno-octulosonic acid transferase [Gammaproteobacteria bacterium]